MEDKNKTHRKLGSEKVTGIIITAIICVTVIIISSMGD